MSRRPAAAGRPLPTVTVVIPVKDDAEALDRCLASLRAQTLAPSSIVVVDNNSDDPQATRDVADRYGAHVTEERRPGIPAASAHGMDRATGDVVARLDADCVAPPEWIEHIATAFQRDPDLSALTGGARFVDGPRWLRGWLASVYLGAYRCAVGAALGHPPLFGSNAALRASDWAEISSAVHRDDTELHDDMDVSLHLGPRRVIRHDRALGMGISIRPFTDAAAFRQRLARGWHTLASHWPEQSPFARWRQRARAAALRRRQRTGRATWRERSRLVRAWRLFSTRRPVTFTEKVQYKMLRDHRQLLVTFADKAAVREYVGERIGAQYLPHAYAISADPTAVLSADLPNEFVMKPTHGSGAAFVVSWRASPDARLPTEDASWVYRHVLPEHADRAALARLGQRWVRQLYGRGPNREWAYGRVPPQIILEELLVAPDGGIPDDYKFFVFHGLCQYIQVDDGRFGRRTQDFFSPSWQHIPMSGGPPWAEPPHERPARLDEMISIAERLGAETDFVRVDLYALADRIVFGELTSYPAGGYSPFEPQSYNTEFGNHWTVPRRY